MYYHVAAYGESLGSVTNSDVDAVEDTVLQRRNSHLIFTEPYDLRWIFANGTTLGRARWGNIALSQKGYNHIWPVEIAAATVPSRPVPQDMLDYPLAMPMNEEVTIEATTTGAGPADITFLLGLTAPGWNRNLPPAKDRLMVRATGTAVAATNLTWGALFSLAMERDLYNGVYSVIGATAFLAGALGFRLYFPRMPLVGGRQNRPGGLATQAIGNIDWPPQHGGLGEWGRFHTFELPQMQVFADAAGGTVEVRLDLLYLGDSLSLLTNW